jgi:tRNA (guanine-N7-)-methyltransferase
VRIRQHVNPLKSNFFGLAVEQLVLPAGVAVEVELGSAEAWFLLDRARAQPDGAYIGVEIRREVVAKANLDAVGAGLPQVRSVFANISVDLPRLFAPGSVRRCFVNFPDPWWKVKQHKRRVINASLVHDLDHLLADGGEVFVNTDIFELALEAMALLESESPHRFANLVEPWTFLRESRFAARSRRELQCLDEGTRVWRLGYVKGRS